MSVSSLTSSPTARAGARDALPFAAAGFIVAVSFGISARAAGMPGLAAIAMSAFVYAGAAQFAAVAILGQGGSVAAAVLAAALMNARYLAMGLSIGPSLKGGRVRRAVEGQSVVDASWALANRGDGRFDRHILFGSSAVQYVTWLTGTVVGVLAGSVLPDPEALGIDVVFPAFFLALLVGELRDRQAGAVAVGGVVVAVVLGLLAPAGIGILSASAVALVGLRRR
ncbi:MAG TPA: AzlC family ABC transporter permease [Baekduia sp.]|nr:AzlC family ABC transporter permease [Baekduia sp.]